MLGKKTQPETRPNKKSKPATKIVLAASAITATFGVVTLNVSDLFSLGQATAEHFGLIPKVNEYELKIMKVSVDMQKAETLAKTTLLEMTKDDFYGQNPGVEVGSMDAEISRQLEGYWADNRTTLLKIFEEFPHSTFSMQFSFENLPAEGVPAEVSVYRVADENWQMMGIADAFHLMPSVSNSISGGIAAMTFEYESPIRLSEKFVVCMNYHPFTFGWPPLNQLNRVSQNYVALMETGLSRTEDVTEQEQLAKQFQNQITSSLFGEDGNDVRTTIQPISVEIFGPRSTDFVNGVSFTKFSCHPDSVKKALNGTGLI